MALSADYKRFVRLYRLSPPSVGDWTPKIAAKVRKVLKKGVTYTIRIIGETDNRADDEVFIATFSGRWDSIRHHGVELAWPVFTGPAKYINFVGGVDRIKGSALKVYPEDIREISIYDEFSWVEKPIYKA